MSSSSSTTLRERMSRCRTPFGAVPISTIYGYDYPLSNVSGEAEKQYSSKHEKLTDCTDYLVRSSRAFSENRLSDPYYCNPKSLSFMPMALRVARSPSPYREESPYTNKRYELFERDLFKPVAPVKKIEVKQAPEPRNKTISFESTTPWNATGFYYTPRYPQSHRGTASTYNAIGRRYYIDDLDYFCPYPRLRYDYFRYPVRRFVPSYVPFRYTRR